ncbi:undecaprenyl-diphosphate phosphatase [Archaeoglobus neptunius]|uniref:undecaprenyl-diphosphate phosphatase n=1 Tax=Archaeoglobus neptunius TaxID=2798580 RepID=UPI001926FB45|nr:undecaprenyl-diphosphate phosphatase [Archaeoglobus neptunius]
MVDIITLTLLSIFQGIFEWLPVSSEGISVFLMINLFKLDPTPALSYAIFLHIGTMLAVLVKFRRDFLKMLRFRDTTLLSLVAVTTVFTAITAIPILKTISGFGNGEVVNLLIGVMLIVTGLILRLPKTGKRYLYELGLKEAALLGLAQGFAIIPGISRSGVTVSFLLLRKLNEEDALKLSFIISVPAVIGAVAVSGLPENVTVTSSILAVFVVFVVGYMAMDLLLKFAREVNFSTFCIAFGLLSVVTTTLLMF